jgi:hypothetical protein
MSRASHAGQKVLSSPVPSPRIVAWPPRPCTKDDVDTNTAVPIGNFDQNRDARAREPLCTQLKRWRREPQHVGVHAGLVDKYQLGGVKQTLLAVPLAARPCDILALLFSGVQAFLLAGDLMTIQETPPRGPTGANALLAQRHQNFLQGRVRPLLDNCQNLLRVLLQPRRASAAQLEQPNYRYRAPAAAI